MKRRERIEDCIDRIGSFSWDCLVLGATTKLVIWVLKNFLNN